MLFFKGLSSRFSRGIICFSFCAVTAFSLSACDLAANYTKMDRGSNMEAQDFRDGLSERLPEVEKADATDSSKGGSIPDLQPYVALTPSDMKSVPLVSVSVNQSVPVKDVLYELAQQANYDLELDPNIRGSIIFTARNKPFDQVIKRIADVAGLRYKFEDGFLRVELDSPFVQTYKIDYLSFVRTNKGSVSNNVSVVSGDGADSGSSYSATSDSSSDFWGELELNLEQILGGASTGGLKTKRDPKITAVEQNPQVGAVSPQNAAGGSGDNVSVQPPQAVLKVESLPIDDEGMPNNGNAASNDKGNGMTYSLNKQAGLINVYAPEKVQKRIGAYLVELKRSVTAQVLVEAKVFEVSLSDEYINGIEWNSVYKEFGVGMFNPTSNALFTGVLPSPGGTTATNNNLGIRYSGNNVDAFVKAISGFGTVRALASPRLTVLNNQSAVLNVATNRVFFDISIDKTDATDTAPASFEIESDTLSVPEGVLINVQPSINLDDRTISMFIRPAVTRIVGTVQDPAVQFVAGGAGIVSEIPEVNIQEIDTVVKVNSGQPIVMGGLLQDRTTTHNEGVPVVGEVPFFGALFKSKEDIVSKTELVIFLKATLIDNPGDTIHDTDRDLYKTFSGDRRPLKL
tara:strand:- start:6924 stop:8807 length:1884 start_codon:yes stop_codon:yes gene_type:complete